MMKAKKTKAAKQRRHTSSRSAKAKPLAKKHGPYFDFVVQDDRMSPTFVRGDHVTIDSRIKSFDHLCEGIFLIADERISNWRLVRPVPAMDAHGRIAYVFGIRQDNVGGCHGVDPAKVNIVGQALILKRQIGWPTLR